VLHFLIENGESDVISAMVLTESHVADFGVGAHGATLGLDQNRQQRFHVRWIGGKKGVGAPGDVGELADVARQSVAQFINARSEGFEVIPILVARVFNDFLQALAVETGGVDADARPKKFLD